MFQQASIPPSVACRHFESSNHTKKREAAAISQLNDNQDVTEVDIDRHNSETENVDGHNSETRNVDRHNSDTENVDGHNLDTENVDGHNSDTENVDSHNSETCKVDRHNLWGTETWDIDPTQKAAPIELNKQDVTELVIMEGNADGDAMLKLY
ncbi:hypothetical protein BJ741DRAFT_575722 [Chytriomyces cf. hyalinus JEL632]|nr:hypothetical protein BJ741DRAFT_575722 [Chytriomyces cf. hyalinus JEL632]